MLVHSGETRNEQANRRLAWTLAAVAGALNTAGFYAVGLYSSNMTGNVSAAADHLALADVGITAAYVALVMTFVLGATASSLLINAGRRRKTAGVYALSILAEAVLLSVLACADLWSTGVSREHLLAYGLSFLMGLQNAVVTRISSARVRTTHVTGMVTDIGIELGNLADLAWHRESRGDNHASDYNQNKLLLHAVTVLSFVCGGIFGVIAYRRFGAHFFFGVALFLLAVALSGLVRHSTLAAASR